MIAPLGASVVGAETRFAVRAPQATQVWLCLFDDHDAEQRLAMTRA